jgi:hypothetical protein
MKWALIRASDNVVVNIIEWDGKTAYDPGEGLALEKVPDHVGPQFIKKGKTQFDAPVEPKPVPTAAEKLEKLKTVLLEKGIITEGELD